jgi:hypothetical protein
MGAGSFERFGEMEPFNSPLWGTIQPNWRMYLTPLDHEKRGLHCSAWSMRALDEASDVGLDDGLFAAALGLAEPWRVKQCALNRRRTRFILIWCARPRCCGVRAVRRRTSRSTIG